jgi:hypothetical protein
MPNLYSIQFEVIPASGQEAGGLLNELLNRVSAWVEEKYKRSWNAQCAFPAANKSVEPLPVHSIHHSCHAVGEGALVRVRWTHPDDRDASMRWTTDIAIAWLGDRIQFALQLGAASMYFVVRPAWLTIGRPRIITDILTDYSCWAGPRPILSHKQLVEASDVPTFVDEILLDDKRTLPVVVVSHDRFKDEPNVDADRLHRTLLGFAHVAVFDKWAAFRLTDSLGKSLSCFNGCIRIYWPGLTRTSDPMQHELYFPLQIERFEFSGKPLDRRLFNFLSKVSAFRSADGEVIREIQAKIDAERLAESERVRKQIQQGASDANTLQDMLPIHEMAMEENASLLERLKQLEKDKSELTLELSTVKSNWNVFQQHQTLTAEDEAAAPQQPEEIEPESPLAALEQAEREFGADLLVLDTAKNAAGASEFARPEEVYRALMAIRDVGNLYFDTVRTGSSMGGWAEQLGKRGFAQYSQTESDTVKNDYRKFGRYREFTLNGSKRKIYQHLDLGGGDRKNCLQIYFEADRKLNRVIIAHCGEHLPFPRQRT